jgi:hypothetical protein
LTTNKENDINKSPNGDDQAGQIDTRSNWPFWIGTGGRFPSEQVAVFIGMRTPGPLKTKKDSRVLRGPETTDS